MFLSCGIIAVGWIQGLSSDSILLRAVVVFVFTIWAAIVTSLVGMLLFFHVYLCLSRQTTFQFLMSQRMEKQQKEEKTQQGTVERGNETIISAAPRGCAELKMFSISFQNFMNICHFFITCGYSPSLLPPLWKIEIEWDENIPDLESSAEIEMRDVVNEI